MAGQCGCMLLAIVQLLCQKWDVSRAMHGACMPLPLCCTTHRLRASLPLPVLCLWRSPLCFVSGVPSQNTENSEKNGLQSRHTHTRCRRDCRKSLLPSHQRHLCPDPQTDTTVHGCARTRGGRQCCQPLPSAPNSPPTSTCPRGSASQAPFQPPCCSAVMLPTCTTIPFPQPMWRITLKRRGTAAPGVLRPIKQPTKMSYIFHILTLCVILFRHTNLHTHVDMYTFSSPTTSNRSYYQKISTRTMKRHLRNVVRINCRIHLACLFRGYPLPGSPDDVYKNTPPPPPYCTWTASRRIFMCPTLCRSAPALGHLQQSHQVEQ